MPLHPDAERLLSAMRERIPDLGGAVVDAAQARALFAELAPEHQPVPVHRVEERGIPGPGGALPVRVYWPAVSEAEPPVVVYFHGGGWVLGGLDSHDLHARNLTNGARAIVVSVDYRLAPEHPFPAPVEDACAALAWAAEHAAELGGDPARIAVAGDSAGGNLATAAALIAARQGAPRPVFQLLVYPVTDHDFTTESYVDDDGRGMLAPAHMRWFWDLYAPDAADRDDPRASPLRAPDLAGLPPAHVVVAECDPLRTEGERYAERLRLAGVRTSLQHCAGAFHGFAGFTDVLPFAAEAMAEAYSATARALDVPEPEAS
ncbi:alpha/beta hydrolase [Saccharopolyspora taberi]|uniref:Alpha/beta hydrolase n=1 Tax=Saccharopolyspora taberi TaxID=60895 RepID=A0ABN3V2F5_9PSEU